MRRKVVISKIRKHPMQIRVNRSQSLIFGERPKLFAHGRSFLVSNLRNSLTVTLMLWATWAIFSQRSLKMREWANRSFFKKIYKKLFKNLQKYDLIQIFWENHCFLLANERMSDLLKKRAIRSLLVSDLSHLLMVAHFWWATWAICSHHSW